MEWYWALLFLLGMVMVPMFLGVPVAISFFGANVIGALIFLGGEAGLVQLERNVVDGLVRFALAPVAMFILMGEILFHTGVAYRAIDAIDKLIAKVPGRLSLVAVVGGTVFSTLSGSSMANTALLGTTLMPEMRRRGYHRSMAMGPILGTGGIAMLIPPSSLAVLLGSLSGISIAGILIAGAIPGMIMAVVHFSYVIIRCKINPSLAPSYDMPKMTVWERVRPVLIYVIPLLSLFGVVVGSILVGIATPTESASLGAIGAGLAAACYRSLTWKGLWKAIVETGKLAVMIYFIIAASLTFSQILAFSGATTGLLQLMQQIEPTPLTLLAGMMVLMLVMGCFMDPVSIMLITLPFFIPIAELIKIDLIWFGVLMLLALEIGQTTPPFGMLLFVMRGISPPDISMRDIYVAVTPFVLLEIGILVFLILVPGVVTWLPDLLAGGG
jgi:tripartite ATP-independent transporter DctM subunit